MANLVTFDITSDDYIDVETAAGVEFVVDTDYTIQGLNNDFYLRSGDTGKGFYVKSLQPVRYTADGNSLYIKKLHNGVLTVNIG